jgi:hypothetical protein
LEFSLRVAESMAARLEGPSNPTRWIELNGKDDRPSRRFEHLLEDLDESRLAVTDPARSGDAREGWRP